MKEYYMGIDVGGTKISYGLFDSDGKLIHKEIKQSDDKKSAEEFFGEIADIIIEFERLAETQEGKIRSVGIGVPGYVDFDRGYLSKVASLPKLSDFYAYEFIKKRINMPDIKVVLDNDGHCGALAEYRHGAGRGHDNMIYALVSTGLSTAMVLDGKLFRGSNGAAGESGHMVTCVSSEIEHDCMCGNRGCFNSLGSGKAIISYVREWIEKGEKTILTDMVEDLNSLTAKHLSLAYDKGDAVAIKAINQMAYYLGSWIFDVYLLLNVDCIVFSGGLLAMGDKLMKPLKERFEQLHTNGFSVNLYETQLGSDTCLIGAMELGRD